MHKSHEWMLACMVEGSLFACIASCEVHEVMTLVHAWFCLCMHSCMIATQSCRFAEHLDVVMLGVWPLERHKDVLDTTEECGARNTGSSVQGEKSSG